MRPWVPLRKLAWSSGLVAALVLVIAGGYRMLGGGIGKDKRGVEEDKPTAVTSTDEAKRNLHILSIGVSAYDNPRYNLNYAHRDAEEIAKTLVERGHGLFEKIGHKTLVNKEATQQEIKDELALLKKRATQYDLVVVTLSGHGAQYGNDDFYFLPRNYDDKLASPNGVYWADFKRELDDLPCTVFIVMDTCHSGRVTKLLREVKDQETALRNGLKKNQLDQHRGIVVLAACMGNGQAEESKEWGHGALTLALLEVLTGQHIFKGKTKTSLPSVDSADHAVTLGDVTYYVRRRVQELAGGDQAVVSNHTGDIPLDRIKICTLQGAH